MGERPGLGRLRSVSRVRGAWDRYNPRLLILQPGEGDLRRHWLLLQCNLGQQIDQGLVRFPRLRRNAGNDVVEDGLVKVPQLCVACDNAYPAPSLTDYR